MTPEELKAQAEQQAAGATAAAKALIDAAKKAIDDKIAKAKAAAEKLKALKDRLKKKKAAPPAFPPVEKFEPKPLPKDEIGKFKKSKLPAKPTLPAKPVLGNPLS